MNMVKKKQKPQEYERPEMGPGSESAQSSLRQIMAQAVAAWESDDFKSAYEQFRGILDEHPEFADVHNKAGLCLAMMGDVDGALSEEHRSHDAGRRCDSDGAPRPDARGDGLIGLADLAMP